MDIKAFATELAESYNAHYDAKKTARTDKFVVVPVTNDGFCGKSPIASAFVQTFDRGYGITYGSTPQVFTISTACELVRNLKGSTDLEFSYVTEVEFHNRAMSVLNRARRMLSMPANR